MTPNQKAWAQARDQLASAVSSLGYPLEFADLLAKQLKSPKAVSRLTSWINLAHPDSVEMIVDEMLAIRAETDLWREKAESRKAQAGYNAWLNSETRRHGKE